MNSVAEGSLTCSFVLTAAPRWRLSLQPCAKRSSARSNRACVYNRRGGVLSGVHIGVDQTARLAKSRGVNLPSLVDQHIAAERTAGRLLGPIPPHLASACQISPIGLIPKPHQPGKWRLIVDLSSPGGSSVNESAPLYAFIVLRILGQGTLQAKMDHCLSMQITTPGWASSGRGTYL